MTTLTQILLDAWDIPFTQEAMAHALRRYEAPHDITIEQLARAMASATAIKGRATVGSIGAQIMAAPYARASDAAS
jgi:hypothetical protein